MKKFAYIIKGINEHMGYLWRVDFRHQNGDKSSYTHTFYKAFV